MIDRSEIERVSEQLKIDPPHVQRDYVHGWLLSQLFSSLSPLKDRLVLKGGNCLRKAYFEGARYSRDLDFSTSDRIAHSDLGRELNAICVGLSERAGIEFDTERTRVEDKRRADPAKTISEARLYFKDFYGNESELVLAIRLDVTHFDRLYLPVQERQLVHPYTDAQECAAVIRCVKLEELLASKMRCLLQRRHIADLFDLVYATLISGELAVNRTELLSTFFRITIFKASPRVAKGLFIELPLEALRSFWEKYIFCPARSWFSLDAAKESLLALIDSLIPGSPIHERSPVLFPSSLRNPIMQAAQTLTLLRMGYDGIARLVEPYSLEFKVRKDGTAREYFSAYDTTGGRKSGPDRKWFLPGKVKSLENTDLPFEPRFEVELSKAGGSEITSRFEGPRRLRAWTSGWSTSPVYLIMCPYCLRRFKRKQLSTSLRPHKDRYGNVCFGRTGYQVWH